MSQDMTFAQICQCFEEAGQSLEIVTTDSGCLACSPAGARIVALSFASDEENIYFTHPDLGDMVSKGTEPTELIGGPGGDRLRFAPEYAYDWEGTDHDLVHFSNYRVQDQEDPGAYTMQRQGQDVLFTATPTLIDRRDGREVPFRVERVVSPLPPPLLELPESLRFAGYQIRQTVTADDLQVDQEVGLWGLIQMPVDSTLLVPTRGFQEPMLYFNEGTWETREDHLRWTYDGETNAKIGFAADQVTGRTGVVRRMGNGQWALVVREFPVVQDMRYCDGPSAEQAGSQVFQAWDGFGFGEMEYHSPAVGPSPLPQTYQDESSVWAFEGGAGEIRKLTAQVLGIASCA